MLAAKEEVENVNSRTLPITLYASLLALAFLLLSGTWGMLYEAYAVPSLIILGFLLLFIAWLLSNTRPAFPGKLLGTTIFYGITGKLFRRFEALTVDISDVLSEEALAMVKDMVLADLDERMKKETDVSRRRQIEKIRERLQNISAKDLRKYVHVYGCRRDFIKHAFVFVSEKSLEDHMFSSPYTSFTIPFGYIRRQALFGIRYDMRGSMKIPPFGKVKAHLFIPLLDPEKVDEASVASIPQELKETLVEIGVGIRSALLLGTENRMLKKEINAMRKRMKETERQLAQLSKETDIARRAAKSHILEEPSDAELKLAKKTPVQARYYELLFAAVGGQVLGAALLPQILTSLDAFTAGVVGSILGAALFFMLVERG
jgi:hypothetical protein